MHLYLLGPGLLSVNGNTHRRQRKLLNPVFSQAQMRRLAPLVHDISCRVRDLIYVRTAESRICDIDCAEWFGRAGLLVLSVFSHDQEHLLEMRTQRDDCASRLWAHLQCP